MAGAGASLIGGMMSSDAAGEASGAQQQASREATQLQREMYEQTRADQAGYRQRGDLAGNRLAYMMGLQPSATGQSYNKTADQFRQELMGQYGGTSTAYRPPTTSTAPAFTPRTGGGGLLGAARAAYESGARPDPNAQQLLSITRGGSDDGIVENWGYPSQGGGSQIDEAGLNAAVQAAMAQQERDRLAAEQAAGGDSAYGSLLRNFSASDLSSDPLYAQLLPGMQRSMERSEADLNKRAEFANSMLRRFGMSDFEADPGYQFRKEEGQRGVENSAAARGGLLSGAALKAIQKYGQDFASNEYSRASDRFSNDRAFSANEYGNAFNRYGADRGFMAGQGDAAYNRFNTNTTNQYNRLAGISGTGQQATNQVNTAGANFANQAAHNTMGAGNAQAAGIVGQANALSGGLTGAYNTYQNNQLMNLIRNPQQTNYGSTPYNAYADIPMQPGGGY